MQDRPHPADELRPRDFHAQVTRRARSRYMAAAKRRRHAARKLAMIAAAAAAPAMAAPDGWKSAEAEQAAIPRPMPFETPGESFPGSAFYYLADQPYLPAAQQVPPAVGEAGLDAATLPTGQAGLAPAARGIRMIGTATDRVRAQQCLAMAIYYEAASESDAGQRAVAQVVLNRVAHPSYPDTVCGVVFQGSERSTGCQFTFTCDGSLARAPGRLWWDRAARVARAALAGAVYAPVGLATHYHTVQVHPYWAGSLDNVGTIGMHRFYRWHGAAGRPGAFRQIYSGGEPVPGPSPSLRDPSAVPDVSADPVILAQTYERGLQQAFAGPIQPADAGEPAIVIGSDQAPPAADSLPAGGSVRKEYARSGQWIARP